MKNGIEMIQDVIQRNYSGSPVQVHEGSHDQGPVKVLHFDIGIFNNISLKNVFSYWKLDWRDWVVEWSVTNCETTGKKRGHVHVTIFVKASLADIKEGDVKSGQVTVRLGNQLARMKVYTLQDANDRLYGSDTPVVYEYEARGAIMRMEELIGSLLGCGNKWKDCANLNATSCKTQCGTPSRHYEAIVETGQKTLDESVKDKTSDKTGE